MVTVERLEIYLSPSPRHAGRWWLAACAALALAACCATVLYWQYGELAQREHDIAKLRRLRHIDPPSPPTRADLDRQAQWDSVQGELDFSWYPIFSALEKASSQQIALLEFIPDKSTGRVVLRGQAKNIDELSAYLDTLSDEAAFREVHLAHQKTAQQNGVATIFFEVRMRIPK